MTRDMKGRKNFDVPTPAAQQRIILVNRPQSPQSVILAGEVLDAKGTDDLLTRIAANDVMGGNFLSRMNIDLRETKGWSYGVRGRINRVQHKLPLILSAPVRMEGRTSELRSIRHNSYAVFLVKTKRRQE